ncbi:hypothetical protein [Hyalangium minutum]|uniref:hypothetical protein n=1 Tax=Hyalangium minutum TaxID=394096 RepID=UPI0004E60343|nr:hypothetical protein [Hyalangium minutum]
MTLSEFTKRFLTDSENNNKHSTVISKDQILVDHVMKGGPLTVVKELMGHATIDMTKRYAHLSPDIRREAVNVLDRPLAPGCDITRDTVGGRC